MATVHIAHIALMQVDNETGNVFTKESAISNFTTNQQPIVTAPRTFATEHRILVNTTLAPNSTGNPTIDNYIVAEYAAGFTIVYMDQMTIITQQ